MPLYKLNYFDLRGKGELCRYIFHAAGRDFEDNRVSRDDWQALKPSMPFGQMPVLEVDGKLLAQSNAIAHFLAREFDLAGKDSWEQALCDQFLELVSDMAKERIKTVLEKDEEKQKELQKNMVDVVYPKFAGYFEKALESNGGSYLVGDSLTLADLAVYSAFDTPLMTTPTLLDSFPKLKAQRARIEALPKIGEYIQHRKPTDR